VAADVVDAYLPAADQAGWSLTLIVSQDVRVNGDPTMLAQVIASLVDNALTHGAPGQTLRVLVARAGADAELSVEDDGPGAPAEELKHLTRRFYRLDRSRHTDGSGLGLSMVAAIASLHGGTLSITNRLPGLAVALRIPLSPS
jgi:signal transduction histidine kinase